MSKVFEETWELPDCIEKQLNKRDKHRLRIGLGNFTSIMCRDSINKELSLFKAELEEMTDFELGYDFAINKLSYLHVNFKRFHPDIYDVIQSYGEEHLFNGLGFAIRGRIPYAYTKWTLPHLDLKPSEVSYELAKEVWG